MVEKIYKQHKEESVKPVVVTNMFSFQSTNADCIKNNTITANVGRFNLIALIRAALKTRNCDAVFINCDHMLLFIMCFALYF